MQELVPMISASESVMSFPITDMNLGSQFNFYLAAERAIFGIFLPFLMDPLKVLVLTDFSPLSKVALQYAVRLSAKLPCELTILNVVRIDGVPKSNMRL